MLGELAMRNICKRGWCITMNDKELKYMKDTYNTIAYLSMGIHIAFVILFMKLDIHSLALYNAVIAVFYVIMASLVYQERYQLATALVHLEVCEFVVGHTLMLGWDCRFYLYMFAMASLSYFNPYKKKYSIFILTVIEICVYFVLYFVMMNIRPVFEQGGAFSVILGFVNAGGSFLVIIVGGIAAGISSHNIRVYQHKLTHDSLTGLYQRKYFFEKVHDKLLENPDKKYSFFISNISEFRIYNELFGIEKGNEVLLEQANILKTNADSSLVYGRLSGDEFGVLVADELCGPEKLQKNIDYLQRKFSNEHYRMIIHVGGYSIQNHDELVDSMCEKARIAMETLKGQYEKTFAFYDDNMFADISKERKLIGEFSSAMQTNQFCVFLQPQTQYDGKVIGAEALVRWKHPEKGLVPPNDFVPVFERVGLICELDMFVWQEVVKRLKSWKERGREDLYISVNISVKDFQHMDLYKVFTGLVEQYGINPHNLKLEITETAMMEDVSSKIDLFVQLQKYGFEIEIDDFGSGYSSLNMLKEVSANVLKLDMGFLGKTDYVTRSKTIIQSVIELSSQLGMNVVAEGVEELEQVDSLRAMGCDCFQGYYFSQPLEMADFEKLYL